MIKNNMLRARRTKTTKTKLEGVDLESLPAMRLRMKTALAKGKQSARILRFKLDMSKKQARSGH